jgi:hypothetical protein
MIRIELMYPTEGTTTWRVKLEADQAPAVELGTQIGVAAETQAVVAALLKQWPKARIVTAAGEVLNPRPPGEWPRLSSHQL